MKKIYLELEVGGGVAFSKDFCICVSKKNAEKNAKKVTPKKIFEDFLIAEYGIELPYSADVYVFEKAYTEYDVDLAKYQVWHYQNGDKLEVLNFYNYLTEETLAEFRQARDKYYDLLDSMVKII